MVELFHYVCLHNRGLTVFLLTTMLCHLVIHLIYLHTYTQIFEIHTHVFISYFYILHTYMHTKYEDMCKAKYYFEIFCIFILFA